MHGLYKRFLVFCAVFVGLMFAASPLLLVGFGVCLAAVNLGDLLKEE